MRAWLRREAIEFAADVRVLCSREFWAAHIDELTSRIRENTGQEPDWDLERRRAKRRVARD